MLSNTQLTTSSARDLGKLALAAIASTSSLLVITTLRSENSSGVSNPLTLRRGVGIVKRFLAVTRDSCVAFCSERRRMSQSASALR